jgi:nucleotide-binding universal stress UspA family protein
MSFRNILILFDGSPNTQRALTDAIELAELSHGRLTLLTSVTHMPALAFGIMDAATVQTAWGEAESYAKKIVSDARDSVPADVPLTTLLSNDPIRVAALDELERGAHDLVVMAGRQPAPRRPP